MTVVKPDQIWTTGTGTTGSWNSQPAAFNGPDETQYIRSDLVEELVEALKECVADMEEGMNVPASAYAALGKTRGVL